MDHRTDGFRATASACLTNLLVPMFDALSQVGTSQADTSPKTPGSPGVPAAAPQPSSARVSWLTFACIALAGCLLTLALRPLDFVHHDTTEALMWSQAPWTFGFWKHPPLLPWLMKLWFSVLPIHPVSIAVLTGLNLAVGAFAVWRIARLVLDERSAWRWRCLACCPTCSWASSSTTIRY
jgi:Dolichyl-phosphate-mannose-protein mannosyltransferase